MLNPSQLTRAMTDVLGTKSDNISLLARKWARAYGDYALRAQAAALSPILTGAETTRMAGLIRSAMAVQSPVPTNFARAMAGAVEAFWLLPPVPFAGPGAAGFVVLFPGKALLVAALASGLIGPKPDSAAASIIASALDAATRTVLVSFAPPPGSTAPLT